MPSSTTATPNSQHKPDEEDKGKTNDESKETISPKDTVDELADAVSRRLHVSSEIPKPKHHRELTTLAEWIQTKQIQKILMVSGAGVSVAAGIPDFRTPGTGLYDNLQKYRLPYPEAIFDLDYFARHPQPFCSLAQQIWPGIQHVPTLTHCFVTLLANKGLLLRHYTQNIDGLEALAQQPLEQLVECHGHFRTAHCIRCQREADAAYVQDVIVTKGQVPKCQHCSKGYLKPDIVFFGEGLPSRFHQLLSSDINNADCCWVMGTSLQVAPVSTIPELIHCDKRVLINRECVGPWRKKKKNSLFVGGDCDENIIYLARLLGWEDELLDQQAQAKAAIQKGKNSNTHSSSEENSSSSKE